MSDAERNGYGNLILLCANCHSEVDVAPGHHTIAKLHGVKAEHEDYCDRLLTVDDERKAIAGEILASAVDLVVEGISLDKWTEWTQDILNPSLYRWPLWAIKEFRLELRPAIYAVLWPQSSETLETSCKLLVQAVLQLYDVFCKRSGLERLHDGAEPGYLVCQSRNRAMDFDLTPESGQRRQGLEKYIRDWNTTLELAMVHLAKCANLFADEARQHVNPRFRIAEGAFAIEPCRFDGQYGIYTFGHDERARIFERGCIEYDGPSPWELVEQLWGEPPTRAEFDISADFMTN